jgi:sulfur carrier protein ThiS
VPLRFATAATGRARRPQRDRLQRAGAREVLPELRGVKGEMLLLRLPELSLRRAVRVLHPRVPVYIVPRGAGLYMVGATMIESDEAARVSARSVLELLSAAYALHPAFGEAQILELGTGVRAAFPDNLPRLQRRGATLYVNGLYRHGFLIAPALARRAAQVVLEGRHFPEVMDEVQVNGVWRETAVAQLAAALTALGYGDSIVTTALNGEFVPWASAATPLPKATSSGAGADAGG